MSVPAQEGTDFVAVTLPEGSRDSALAGGGSSGSRRSCWICVCVCPLCLDSRPASPAGGILGIFTPGVNQQGFPRPLLFLWTRKPEITRCSGDRSRSGERPRPDFGRGVIFSELVKSFSRRRTATCLVSSQSCVCVSNIKVLLPYPQIYPCNPFSSPRAVSARPPRCAVSG